jgi:hypothetical protein
LSVRFISYKHIDKVKWDACIHKAINGLIYARSSYLDTMAEHWDAIVLNDYEAVMPLTWKTKWGIRYLYQPAFIQQSGIFFTTPLSETILESFLHLVQEKFRFAEITLNFFNHIKKNDNSFELSQRNNYVLDLNRSYELLYENYDPAFTKSLRRIQKFEMLYVSSINYKKTVDLYKHLYGSRLPFFSGKSYSQFEKICKELFKNDSLVIRHARSTSNKQLASVILLKDEKRLYNIISCITSEGKKLEANYFLYDQIIHEFANTPLMLDFEGSDVEGIAAFYKKFNPENQQYPFIRYNNLPPFVKLFKR